MGQSHFWKCYGDYNKCPTIYGTLRFITVFAIADHRSRMNPSNTALSYLKSTLILHFSTKRRFIPRVHAISPTHLLHICVTSLTLNFICCMNQRCHNFCRQIYGRIFLCVFEFPIGVWKKEVQYDSKLLSGFLWPIIFKLEEQNKIAYRIGKRNSKHVIAYRINAAEC
jgi:hypothetical protein